MPMPGYSRDHNGHITVGESDQRWCSDGLEFKCFNGDTVSMTFVLDCCDREAISFVWNFTQNGTALLTTWDMHFLIKWDSYLRRQPYSQSTRARCSS